MIFLFFLFSQVIPIDLPRLAVIWQGVNKKDAYFVALKYDNLEYAASTLALMRIEQPGKEYFLYAPNHNYSGFHPFAEKRYWGWSRKYFNPFNLPIGYFICREAMTKRLKPYLAFSSFQSHFDLVYRIVKNRNIIRANIYYARWVGNPKIINRKFDLEKQKILLELNQYRKKFSKS